MHTQTAFTPAQRSAIEALRGELTRRVQRTVTVDFGATDCGQFHDAAFVVNDLPAGAWGRPGPLVSILAGAGIGSPSFVVMGADGDTHAEADEFDEAVNSARFAGVRRYRAMLLGTAN